MSQAKTDESLWEDTYNEYMKEGKVEKVVDHLKNIISTLVKTHKSSFVDWPQPNPHHHVTLTDIFLDISGDIMTALWTPFGAIRLEKSFSVLDTEKQQTETALKHLLETFILTDVTQEFGKNHGHIFVDKLYVIEPKDNARMASECETGRQLLLLANIPLHSCFSKNVDTRRNLFKKFFGETFLSKN